MGSKYRAEQDVAISAFETGAEFELRMVVNFTVHTGCKQTLTEPGEEPSAEVDQVQFFRLVDGKPVAAPSAMPVWMIDALTEGDEFNVWLLSEADEQRQAALADAADAMRDERMGL